MEDRLEEDQKLKAELFKKYYLPEEIGKLENKLMDEADLETIQKCFNVVQTTRISGKEVDTYLSKFGLAIKKYLWEWEEIERMMGELAQYQLELF